MDIDKVNATLGKALSHIHESELADMHELFIAEEGDGEPGDFVEAYFDGLVDQVVESSKVSRKIAGKAVQEAAEKLAGKSPVRVQTEADLDAWAKRVKLADAIAKNLAA